MENSERQALLELADRFCRHEFDLLGSGPVQVGAEIDWHRDFKSGYRFDPRSHYTRIGWDTLPEGVDIKVPWELSRCAHFVTLALADRLSGNPRYYEEFRGQILHWIAANRPGRGVNWCCAMDVAIRVVNWITALQLLNHRVRSETDVAFLTKVAEALWMAGRHLRRNLEWGGPGAPTSGNHFLADLVGLLAVGQFFAESSAAEEWRRFAVECIEAEMDRQVHPDGSGIETSTYYHRLVMEMFLWAEAVGRRSGAGFSASYRARLRAMGDFVAAYCGRSLIAPQFGDNDNGRLIACGIGSPTDHRYLTTACCGFGGLIDRALLGGGVECAGDGRREWFPDGGYYFGSAGRSRLGVRAGPVTHRGLHAHCDQLSFVLSIEGRELVVDRGTGSYTAQPALRNELRSTMAHNALSINGWEQNSFGTDRHELFGMADDTRTVVTCWQSSPESVDFEARHHGFSRYRPGLMVGRRLHLEPEGLRIEDTIQGSQTGDVMEWSFHLPPRTAVNRRETVLCLQVADLCVTFAWDAMLECSVETSAHSPAYGVVESAPVIRLRGRPASDGRFCAEFSFSWTLAEPS